MALQSGQYPYDGNRLKQAIYGTSIPGLVLETQRMMEEARRLAPNVSEVQQWFPNGFGAMARSVLSWRAENEMAG